MPPYQRTQESWDQRSAEYWSRIAKDWDDLPNQLTDAIPNSYRRRIDQLRRWEPWDDEEFDGEANNRGADFDEEEFKKEIEQIVKDLERTDAQK